MGKVEDEHQLPISTVGANGTDQNVENNSCRSRFSGFLKFRCVFALLFGGAVLLSAIFLLPFFHSGDLGDLDLDPKFRGHDIVASFMLEKPASLMEDYTLQLEDDIFDEISVSNTKVEIISLENITGSNITRVVFAVDSDVKNMRISPTALSLVRSEFETVITHPSFLHLTASLFGDPFSFDVLKLRGGITVIPKQIGFLMQNVQIRFNFTLNSSIDEIQDKFDELTSQLKSGVHLASYENLYIKLTNTRGSTVNPPTIVQCQVLLAVGINPSNSRLKQLAQTIGSNSKNLGLNNTVFGRVKQVSLSSILQHSLGSPSPSPAPQPYHPHQHHHHHSRHHHRQGSNVAPAISPAPRAEKRGSVSGKVSPILAPVPSSAPVVAPAPIHSTHKGHVAKPPCHFERFPRKATSHPPVLPPIRPPVPAPHIAPSPPQKMHAPTPVPHEISASSPLPSVVYAHTQPPPMTPSVAEPPHRIPSGSKSPSSSSTGSFSSNLWALSLFLLLVPRL
ncbi:PREDICTED: vacuolar protein-sorting protein bro1-like [Nicotiana attenuata]|uniref:DUF7036 domain-containing protein n=1 Tax=Nicotiana attenuata TaxID=49451 RepID=A0A1J6IAQ7_NICAT|nr:PREDICTED: vacuolar protein-sorting protein bro1-like [Nicotiana attenuata]OIS97623.1 hypothetical protein A4A49_17879 [Nicotiana attenuata]